MRWEKKGLIFKADARYPWMVHHASIPVAHLVSESVLRIYFGPRDAQGRTRTAFIDVDADDLTRVLRVHDKPVLDLGALGAFDDSGAMPSCLVRRGSDLYMYYIGWNQGVTVPYRNSIGLAVSTDGGETFERVCDGPVIDRTQDEPYFTSTPFVIVENGLWRAWYTSTTGFRMIDGRAEPRYQVKYAESDDGRDWRRPNSTCLNYSFEGEANARPSVIAENGIYRMWYCFRDMVGYRTEKKRSYRIGYAESDDGLRWDRMDDRVGTEPSQSGWDSMMMAYPFVFEHRGMKHMLYCGNGFGESGFGYAVLTEDDTAVR